MMQIRSLKKFLWGFQILDTELKSRTCWSTFNWNAVHTQRHTALMVTAVCGWVLERITDTTIHWKTFLPYRLFLMSYWLFFPINLKFFIIYFVTCVFEVLYYMDHFYELIVWLLSIRNYTNTFTHNDQLQGAGGVSWEITINTVQTAIPKVMT